jgi:hypothetical protein
MKLTSFRGNGIRTASRAIINLLYPSVENVSQLNRLHIHALFSTEVQVLDTRTPGHAHWLAHFFWGLIFVTTEKEITIKMFHSDDRSLVTFFWCLILWQQATFFNFASEKKHQNIRQSDFRKHAGTCITPLRTKLFTRAREYTIHNFQTGIFQPYHKGLGHNNDNNTQYWLFGLLSKETKHM